MKLRAGGLLGAQSNRNRQPSSWYRWRQASTAPSVSAQAIGYLRATSRIGDTSVTTSMTTAPTARVLVCPPTHFGVEYVINPWMAGNIGAVCTADAQQQWHALVNILSAHCEVSMIDACPGLPDMCFVANGGFALGSAFVPATFAVSQRSPEAALFRAWASAAGYDVVELEDVYPFEGEGDALWWPGRGLLWAGYGVRSSLECHRALAEQLRIRVASLHLIDARFYHLDTCFAALPAGRVVYYPAAFDQRSRRLVESLAPPHRRIEIGDEDALNFACNAVRLGNKWIGHYASDALRRRLEEWGYEVITTPLGEFIKAGGAAKCLTLLLDQDVPDCFENRPPARSSIRTEAVAMEGHLLDASALPRTFELVAEAGGSVRIERFGGGARADQTSHAHLQVSAPDRPRLQRIVRRLRNATPGIVVAVTEDADDDAALSAVGRAGVAPDDFYCSTIYPTDVRVAGRWLRVRQQRMDATIRVSTDADAPTATCVLTRDLRPGDQVVCGENGVRVRVPKTPRAGTGFGFMSADVSSERHVENTVQELALEMRRIRARHGRIVVVAGPVVVHTGGGRHLAELVRRGYVQALLAGNALAVHDLEANLYGTSLGVDLARGATVRGGHQHHLRAINRIRAAGDIANAVASGLIDSGVMFECVRNGVPFELAGSIRDDGPLPDTRMDLIAAQAAYAGQLADADLILMLATMLHAIGAGNMTPAGVRMVCVDINPAVVTKLRDRGSVESTGIVTDVGLFLNLLTQRL